jgi:hypothetical protein
MTVEHTEAERLDRAVREAAQILAKKTIARLAEFDAYDLSDVLYDCTQQHGAWAANKALEALKSSEGNEDTQAVQDHLEALRVQFLALTEGYFAKVAAER